MNLHNTQLERAQLALQGLSIGDAFGQQLAQSEQLSTLLEDRIVPAAPWATTAITASAVACLDDLRQHGTLRTHSLLSARPSEAAATALLLGAFFADDFTGIGNHIKAHTIEEGTALSALALAAAWAWRIGQGAAPDFVTLIDLVLEYLPQNSISTRLQHANALSPGMPAPFGAAWLGNTGSDDTREIAPFAIWCAGSYLNDFSGALWHTAFAQGALTANCAIVGGIVALATGAQGIPHEWQQNRVALPNG